MGELSEKARDAARQVSQVVLGKDQAVNQVLLALLANGHVLLEDIPGVGKTTLALAFARTLDLQFRRIQFTPDVMPSDLTGFSIYRRDQEKFVYQPGNVFCNLLLADELNRTSPKTQSALLEVMEERRVTVEGVTRETPLPFLVIATQNPYGSAGTQRLPESQADRFMISISLGYPDRESEITLAKSVQADRPLDRLAPVVSREELLQMQKEIHEVWISDPVYRYLVELVAATREHPALERGASPRATVSLVKMAKAAAWLQGDTYVTPNEVLQQFPYVALHRILLHMDAKLEQREPTEILREIAAGIKKPPMGK